MKNEICVVIETLRGEVCDISYTMLAAGRQLADALRTKLTALLMSDRVQDLAGTLGVADRVIGVEAPALADFNPEACLRIVSELWKEQTPRIGLLGHTAIGTDLACGLAHRLQVPIATCCKQFTCNGDPEYTSVTCGGKMLAFGEAAGAALRG